MTKVDIGKQVEELAEVLRDDLAKRSDIHNALQELTPSSWMLKEMKKKMEDLHELMKEMKTDHDKVSRQVNDHETSIKLSEQKSEFYDKILEKVSQQSERNEKAYLKIMAISGAFGALITFVLKFIL